MARLVKKQTDDLNNNASEEQRIQNYRQIQELQETIKKEARG
jgi:predicted DNA binding CopG/RHH family protein